MTKIVIPPEQRRRIVAAADTAYDVLRGHVGDRYEVAELVQRLAHECWLAGHEHGLKTGAEAGK